MVGTASNNREQLSIALAITAAFGPQTSASDATSIRGQAERWKHWPLGCSRGLLVAVRWIFTLCLAPEVRPDYLTRLHSLCHQSRVPCVPFSFISPLSLPFSPLAVICTTLAEAPEWPTKAASLPVTATQDLICAPPALAGSKLCASDRDIRLLL